VRLNRDRRRVELGELDLAGGADGVDRRVAVQAVEQHDQYEREREREDHRAPGAQLDPDPRAQPAAEEGEVGTAREGHAVSLVSSR
jgi:hypothetical protein